MRAPRGQTSACGEVKAILVGCQAMEAYNSALAERVTDVVVDGLRAQR